MRYPLGNSLVSLAPPFRVHFRSIRLIGSSLLRSNLRKALCASALLSSCPFEGALRMNGNVDTASVDGAVTKSPVAR